MSFSFQESRNVASQVVGPPPRPEEDRRSRVPNLPLLVATVALILFVTPIILFAHRVQMIRVKGMYLEAANTAIDRQKWVDAERHLRNYLAIEPDDGGVLARLAYVVDKGAYSWSARLRSVSLYSQALDRLPQRNDLRVRIAELQLDTNPGTALKTAETALTREPANGNALAVKAKALHAMLEIQDPPQADVERVISAYHDAHQKNSANIECAVALAKLYRQYPKIAAEMLMLAPEEMPSLADKLIDEMVNDNPKSPDAYMSRFNYRQSTLESGSRRTTADDDVRRAMELDPQAASVRIAAAQSALDVASADPLIGPQMDASDSDKKSFAIAAEHLRLAIFNNSFDYRGYLGLSYIDTLHHRYARAIDVLADGLMKGDKFQPMLNIRLAELLLHEQRWAEADRAIGRLETSIQVMRERQRLPSEIQQFDTAAKVLRATLYLAPENPTRSLASALPLLRDASRLSSSVTTTAGTNYRLGKAYGLLAQWDLAAAAFRNAASTNPDDLMSAVGAADAFRRGRRYMEAAEQYRRILSAPTAERLSAQDRSSLWIDLTRAQLGALLHLPADRRPWKEFEDSIAKARESNGNAIMPLFLEISSRFLGRAKNGETFSSLGSKGDRQAEFWRVGGDVYRMMARARQDAGEKKDADDEDVSPSFRLAESSGNGMQPLARMRASMEYFANGPASFRPRVMSCSMVELPPHDLAPLLRQAEKNPKDWQSNWDLALAAIERGDEKELLAREKELEGIEGPEGTLWRYARVQRLILESRNLGPAGLERLSELARQLNARRPDWAMSRVADGLVLEAMGRFDDAALAYRSAVDLGDYSPRTLGRLLGTLSLSDKPDEAWKFAESLAEEDLLNRSVLPLVVATAIRQGKVAFALRASQMAEETDPSPLSKVQLGLSLMAMGGIENWLAAEAVLREAEVQSPAHIAVRIARLHLYVNHDLPAASNKGVDAVGGVIEMLGADGKPLPPASLSLVLASLFTFNGDLRLSESYARRAAQSTSRDDFSSALPEGLFVSMAMVEPTANLWDGYLQSLPEAVRRTLGIVLFASGATHDQQLGEPLLGADVRLKAMAFVARGGPKHRSIAREMLSSIQSASQGRDDVLIARLCRVSGKEEEAHAILAKASASSRDESTWLDFVDAAIAVSSWSEAETSLASLQEMGVEESLLAPRRIRCHVGLDRMDLAMRVAQDYVDPKPTVMAAVAQQTVGDAESKSNRTENSGRREKRARAVAAAGWLAAAGQAEKGTELLRGLASQDPGARGMFAEWLASQPGGFAEAVELCTRENLESQDSEGGESAMATAQVWARVLLHGSLPPDRMRVVEDLFQRCTRDAMPADGEFLVSLAELREAQGRSEEAIELAKRAADDNPKNPATWNLLARLLAAEGSRLADATLAVRRGESLAGPRVDLLMTRGMIFLGSLNGTEAVRVFEASLVAGASPIVYLHLADAYEEIGARDESRRMLTLFQAAKVGPLTPRDAKAWKRLSAY
ncbi:MAG: tetratricopeptide repeat protein [Planctomycetota bacterium]